MSLAALMLGTKRLCEPSSFSTSTASPRLTISRRRTYSWPSASRKLDFITGTDSRARSTPYPIRWVKLTFPPPPADRNRLITRRFSSRSLAGMKRNDVAVGTSRLACMFLTTRSAPNRIRSAPSGMGLVGAAGACEGPSAGLGAFSGPFEAPALATSRTASATMPVVAASTSPRRGRKSSKNSRHLSSTASGFSRYRRYISSTSHMFGPRADGSISSYSLIDSSGRHQWRHQLLERIVSLAASSFQLTGRRPRWSGRTKGLHSSLEPLLQGCPGPPAELLLRRGRVQSVP